MDEHFKTATELMAEGERDTGWFDGARLLANSSALYRLN